MCHETISAVLCNAVTLIIVLFVAGMQMLILVMMSALTWVSLKDNVTISHRAPPTSFRNATKLSERTEELLNRLHQPVSQRGNSVYSVVLLGNFHALKDIHLPFTTFLPKRGFIAVRAS